jgi:hypothetical protein
LKEALEMHEISSSLNLVANNLEADGNEPVSMK